MSYYKIVSNKSIKLRKRVFRLVVVACLLSTVVFAALSYRKSSRQVALDYANAEVFSLTANAINDAVYTVMSELNDAQLVTVMHNSVGDVVLLQANSSVIGQIARETAKIVESKINTVENLCISIPVGTLSGITFLIGSGPKVKFTLEPIGSVECKIYSQFESAGINQTLHKITATFTIEIRCLAPFHENKTEIQIPLVLSEVLIAGAVPEVLFPF